MRRSISIATLAMMLSTSLVYAGNYAARGSYRSASSGRVRTASYGSGSCGCGAPTSCGCESIGCDSVGCDSVGCDDSCGSTQVCCPRLLPLLMGKLDCLLQTVFYNPCNVPCCRTRPSRTTCCSDAWFDYAPGCGCNSGTPTNWSPAPTPSKESNNPFMDDDLKMPPQVPKEARIKRMAPSNRPTPARHASHAIEPTSVPKVRVIEVAKVKDEPRQIELVKSEVRESKVPVASKPVSVVKRPLQQVKHETSTGREIPNNPLRNE